MKYKRDKSTSQRVRQTLQELVPPLAEAGEAGAGRGSRRGERRDGGGGAFKMYWKVLESAAASQRGHV